jgi:hypothetical protein
MCKGALRHDPVAGRSARVPLLVRLSSERPRQAVRQDCSSVKKQESPSAPLFLVRSAHPNRDLDDGRLYRQRRSVRLVREVRAAMPCRMECDSLLCDRAPVAAPLRGAPVARGQRRRSRSLFGRSRQTPCWERAGHAWPGTRFDAPNGASSRSRMHQPSGGGYGRLASPTLKGWNAGVVRTSRKPAAVSTSVSS